MDLTLLLTKGGWVVFPLLYLAYKDIKDRLLHDSILFYMLIVYVYVQHTLSGIILIGLTILSLTKLIGGGDVKLFITLAIIFGNKFPLIFAYSGMWLGVLTLIRYILTKEHSNFPFGLAILFGTLTHLFIRHILLYDLIITF